LSTEDGLIIDEWQDWDETAYKVRCAAERLLVVTENKKTRHDRTV